MGDDGKSKVYSLAEVSQHSNPKDCWLVIHGKVYDVTKFLDDHPGGDEVLLSSTGKDATDDFEDVGHSETANKMLDGMYVGEIDKSTLPGKTTTNYVTQNQTPPPPQKKKNNTNYQDNNTPHFFIKLLQFLVPLVILAIAVGVKYYTKPT